MINAIKLQEKIIAEPDKIMDVLNGLGYQNVTDRGKYLQFSNKDGDNKTAISLYKETLKYINYTRGRNGNLFTLVMDDKKCNLPEALQWVCKVTGEDKTDFNQKITYPFHSFYKSLVDNKNSVYDGIPTYSDSLLPASNCFSKMFSDDGISINSQSEYGVRYSCEDDAILIPIYNIDHSLVGVKARNNNNNDYNNRWYAWLPYSKTKVVYGLDKNYCDIINKKTLIIYESEKGVLQSHSCGLNCTGAIAGHNISEAQSKIIKSMMADNIIVAFDEGIEEEEIRYEASKLQVDNHIYHNNVYYLYDRNHDFLPIGSKNSPSDMGKCVLQKMLKSCKYKL